MRPPELKTKLFLDSADSKQTQSAIDLLGFLDGQTTNPTLLVKSLGEGAQVESQDKMLDMYKQAVSEISTLIPRASVSIEVYADEQTSAQDMVAQARTMYRWIQNAHIKLPTTAVGLTAAQTLARDDHMRLNMTLCFSQAQGAAVHMATKAVGVEQSLSGYHNVFVSPFVGRLDDRGENGLDLVKNCLTMYREIDSHVGVLAASARTLEHLVAVIAMQTPMVTAPLSLYEKWVEAGMPCTLEETAKKSELTPIEYAPIDLSGSWEDVDIAHELTDAGLKRFAQDWNAVIKQ